MRLILGKQYRGHRKGLTMCQAQASGYDPQRRVPYGDSKLRVYPFVKGSSPGKANLKKLLGGKGANLCEMARIGLNVPAGFTITTEVCQQFYDNGHRLPNGLMAETVEALKIVEESRNMTFGSKTSPLLLSVRSGAAVSMPGMMDTVLNLGLNDEILPGFANLYGERFAYDCFRRLLDMFGDVVLGIPHEKFESEIAAVKKTRGYKYDIELQAEDLKEIVERFKTVYEQEGKALPEDPYVQLEMSINAVFSSWNTPRAVKYREINRITGLIGTAVNVQSMVFGNKNNNCATGVCFTRNPATGEPGLYGEFLVNAQGEDVVAGIRTPIPVQKMSHSFESAFQELKKNSEILEQHMGDMQDTEFTIEDGELFMLQTRNGKRTGQAALQIALDMANEGLVSKKEAILMVEPRHLEQLLHPTFTNVDSQDYSKSILGKGLPASPGAGCGKIVFTAEKAEELWKLGEKVILVRRETSPEDVGGMHASMGILTARGGMTSHAAVVARGWGKPCICGCDALTVDTENLTATINGVSLKEGDWISLNGGSGEILLGEQPTEPPKVGGKLGFFMKWVNESRRMKVMTNCDTPEDAKVARENGAQGIGLVRTEHMFFSSPERIMAVQKMIAAEELHSEASEALLKLQYYQKLDFEGIFREMEGLPVTIRLLDPPLHEFLPKEGPELEKLCSELAAEYHYRPGKHLNAYKVLKRKLKGLNEVNPMMGMRGCRLGILHPNITKMQVTAIAEAAIACKKSGVLVMPQIMIPLVGFEGELKNQISLVRKTLTSVFDKTETSVDIKVGTMIEVPRGALRADELAKHADFFSIGSNDLTQMTLGFSRDDAEAKFMDTYIKEGILASNPFDTLDTCGVGELINIAVERGRKSKPSIEIGICGEHGGDPKSIEFVSDLSIDYVSCSPLRIPVACLAAAQANIKKEVLGENDHCQD